MEPLFPETLFVEAYIFRAASTNVSMYNTSTERGNNPDWETPSPNWGYEFGTNGGFAL